MPDLLGAPPLAPFRSCIAQSSSIEDRRWRGSGDDDGRKERETKRRQAMVQRHHGGMGPLEELWHPGQLAKDVAGKSLVGVLLERVGSATCSTCLSPALPAWVASCVRLQARSGGEAISVCFVFFFLSGGEEAARQYTAITMILKSHAHTASRKFRRRGCCGSTSFTTLHDAQMTVHT